MIKNIYSIAPDLVENIHDGEGTARVSLVADQFATNMQFLHYTVLPPAATIGSHQHGNNEELYIVLEGQGEMELDGVTHPVKKGDVIINKPYGAHGLRNTSDTEDL
ncbi:MAG: cupin domain-containing protein, partial [Defluviitaleaceae bacterium]|nr:cupin domain-containing protein [Defluviitaleaceae bacterium]